jgi:hypothetical protein
LEGKAGSAPLPAAIEERNRLYELVRITGWTLEQIEATPAVDLDWLVQIDRVHREVEAGRGKPG